MDNIIKKIKMFFVMKKAEKELAEAIKLADAQYRTHNRRFYVIPDTKHKLRVFSWSQLKQMRSQGLFSSHCRENDFVIESFYYTPSRFGEFIKPNLKERKRKQWLEYYKAYRL